MNFVEAVEEITKDRTKSMVLGHGWPQTHFQIRELHVVPVAIFDCLVYAHDPEHAVTQLEPKDLLSDKWRVALYVDLRRKV